jgi:hypothetical protein
MRTELEVGCHRLASKSTLLMPACQTRMVHCKPAELLLAEQGLTTPTERMLKHFAGCVFAVFMLSVDVMSKLLTTGALRQNVEFE